ncbi:hypothetical protein CDL12_09785 [Handroanthus impetiginosus]|uniref:Uncharacterized protein n=1 Tax=Handroanthus impetiginosus TaxID=429701 RepID=A0A2G9HJ70_9LAMI|nr:hypothetical protein CDL12_09785 [Handroanthus impetiginosus]
MKLQISRFFMRISILPKRNARKYWMTCICLKCVHCILSSDPIYGWLTLTD